MAPEDYAKQHQKAFRTAFDYLAGHFPPQQTDEWWIAAAQDLSAAGVSAGETPLVIELLNAVYNYLGIENKKRSDNNGKTDN